jgi:DNA gyrase/topoisomerase IV subunit A
MAKIAAELLADIDKETVDFVPNYGDSSVEPLPKGLILRSTARLLLASHCRGISRLFDQ